MLRTFLRNNKGFSLIELMVSVTIIGLITSAIFSFYTNGVRTFDRDYSRLTAQQNARQAFIRLSQCLRLAKDITVLSQQSVRIITPNDSIVYYYLENDMLYREKNKGKNPIARIKDLAIKELLNGNIEIKIIAVEKNQIIEISSEIIPYGSYITKIK